MGHGLRALAHTMALPITSEAMMYAEGLSFVLYVHASMMVETTV
jgi:hypothetical protein